MVFGRGGSYALYAPEKITEELKLDYENCPEQFREVHFAKTEKRARYELLKEKLLSRLG